MAAAHPGTAWEDFLGNQGKKHLWGQIPAVLELLLAPPGSLLYLTCAVALSGCNPGTTRVRGLSHTEAAPPHL